MNELEVKLQIDGICDRFELEWKAGSRPRLEDCLGEVPAAGLPALLRELILLDIAYRRRRGESPSVEDYRSLFSSGLPDWLLREAASDRAGRYRLLGEIARGGMGVVYRADDPNLDRELAIKTLLPHVPADRADRFRALFLREAHITARLQHPNIPPVYEQGELADGRPFFAMKFVGGSTLEKELAGQPAGLETPRFLRIFLQVCQGVAYAHSCGFIHRDLKPRNVMVGEFGEVQVMDWGLARELRESRGRQRPGADMGPAKEPDDPLATTPWGSTQEGQVMGTPAYLPPEQARGEVGSLDRRCDVFSLGALLCQILTGHPPYTGPAIMEKAKVADLSDAFARLDACGADSKLAALCKECLAEDREARPIDAGEVAKRVAAYQSALEERLRQAELERAEAAVRAAEEAKRRKVRRALGVAVLLLVSSGGAFAWWQDRQATQREQARERNRNAFTASLEQCEQALRETAASTARLALDEVEKRLPEEGMAAFELRVERCRRELGTLEELDRIDNYRWTELEGKHPDWERIGPQMAEAFSDYGIAPGVTSPSDAARRIGDSFIRERLLTSLEVWFVNGNRDARLRAMLSEVDPDEFRDEARATDYQRALLSRAFRGKPLPAAQPLWFAVAHGGDRRNVDRGPREYLLLNAHRTRPNSYSVVMGLGAVYDFDDRVVAPTRAGWYRAALTLQPKSVSAWNDLGNALRVSGDSAGAIAAFKEAIRLNPKSAYAHNNLGITLMGSDDPPGAMAALKEAIRLDPTLAGAHNNLGAALAGFGDRRGAIAAYKEAIRLNPKLAIAHYNLGRNLYDSQDFLGAIAAYKEAIKHDSNYAPAHSNLGLALNASGNFPGAIAACQEAIRLDPKYALAHRNLALALNASGNFPGAIAAFKEAIRLDPKNAMTYYDLGNVLLNSRDYTGAIAAYREAIRLDPKNANAHTHLGLSLNNSGDRPSAITAYREAIRLDPTDIIPRNNLGVTLYDSGDFAGAIAVYREAIPLNPKFARTHANLGEALLANGDLDEAIEEYREAVRLDPKKPRLQKELDAALTRKAERDGKIAPLPREKK